jgi:hypothetical protein
MMQRGFAVVAALTIITVVAGITMRSVAASAASRPSGFVRTCGAITFHGRYLRVDLGEGSRKAVTCPHARRVMRHFLRTHDREFRVYRHRWGCYKSRRDGQGWDYHCLAFTRPYVDVAAGRRW